MQNNKLKEDQPLYLPEGSVRAILAIVLLIVCSASVLQDIKLPEWFTSITTVCFGFYFGSRSSKKENQNAKNN